MIIIGWRIVCFRPRSDITVFRRCIRIPIIVWVGRDFELPSPPEPPWLLGEDITPELAHDLRALATIDALAQTLSDAHKKAMLDAVQKQFDAVKLPDGMEIPSHREMQAASAKSS
jgi:hypothetical protein